MMAKNWWLCWILYFVLIPGSIAAACLRENQVICPHSAASSRRSQPLCEIVERQPEERNMNVETAQQEFSSKPAVLMVEAAAVPNPMAMLCEADFPTTYSKMAHHDDYKIAHAPIVPEYIYHHKGRHRRLIFRVSWKINDSTYIPMSFVCDTGAPYFLYLSEEAREVLEIAGMIREDDKGDEFVRINIDDSGSKESGFIAGIEDTPVSHKPANLIGLSMLLKLGLQLKHPTFSFSSQVKHL